MPEETTQLPVSERETQIQTPSFLDKLKIHKFKILIGVLGFSVFAGVVFGVYKLGQRSIYPLPIGAPVKEGDLTANWETYTNTKYSYSVKYPPQFTPKESTDDTFLMLTYFENPSAPIGKKLAFSIQVGEDTLEREVELVKWEVEHITAILTREENINFQGYPAVRLEYKPEEGADFDPFTYVVFNNGKYSYTVNVDQAGITDQILSTFKFLEEEENLTNIIGKILNSPQNYLNKQVEIVGYYRGWDLLGEAGTGPPVTKSDWVIKDASGAIYVSVAAGYPVPVIANLEPSSIEDTNEVISLKGIVKINPEGIPYIQPI